jgi:hypothetical protein
MANVVIESTGKCEFTQTSFLGKLHSDLILSFRCNPVFKCRISFSYLPFSGIGYLARRNFCSTSVFCGLFIGCSSLFLRSSFALPSLQSRDNNIGFRETGVKQTYLFAVFEAGYSGADRANFMRE